MNSALSTLHSPLRVDIWRGKLGVLQLEYALVIDHAAHMVIFGPCDGDNWKPGAIPMLTPDEATTLGTALESAGLKLKGIFSPQVQLPLPCSSPARRDESAHESKLTKTEHNRYPNGRYQHLTGDNRENRARVTLPAAGSPQRPPLSPLSPVKSVSQ